MTSQLNCVFFTETHYFWLWYKSPQRVSSPGMPWPTILWLQGGPVHAYNIINLLQLYMHSTASVFNSLLLTMDTYMCREGLVLDAGIFRKSVL